jgi:hypothetical protein
MARNDPVEQALDRLGELRRKPPNDLGELRAFLRDRSNLVVSKAARLCAELDARSLIPDLVGAFQRLMADAPRRDKRCAALTQIIAALYQLDYPEPALYLQSIRHRQLEASFGPPVDAAAKLRGLGAQGLLRTRHPNALHEVVPLLVDSEPPARIGAVRALAANGGDGGLLLLQLKALTGDTEPEVMAECFAGLLSDGSERSVTFVAQYLDSEDPALVEAAILALGDSRNQLAFEILKQKWGRTANAQARKIILLAMASSRREDPIAFLISVVKEAAMQTAADAVEALSVYRSNDRIRKLLADAIAERNQPAVTDAFRLRF